MNQTWKELTVARSGNWRAVFLVGGVVVVMSAVFVAVMWSDAHVLPPCRAAVEFSREGELAASYLGDRGICADIEGTPRHGLLDQVEYFERGTVVQAAGGDKFFLVTKESVSLYDSQYREIGNVGVSDFEVSAAEYRFRNVIGVTDDGLWVKLEHILGDDGLTVEWTMAAVIPQNNLSDSKLHTFGEYSDAAVGRGSKLVYVILEYTVKDRNLVIAAYDAQSRTVVRRYTIEQGDWWPFAIEATGDNDVFLVSGFKGKHEHFAVFDAKSGDMGGCVRGENACALADGRIYFNRGNVLWCMERAGRPEIVFSPSKRSRRADWFNQLHVSSDRWAVVFDYCLDSATRSAFGRLILDTKAGEFKEIGKGTALKASP